MSLEAGKIVEGKVSGITNFGAFVDIGEGKTGLVHISEVASKYVKDVHEFLTEGQTVKVKIISVEQGGKISLSIKQATEEKPRTKAPQSRRPIDVDFFTAKEDVNSSFEDKMLKFKQMSDERMQDIKRNVESKRGGHKRGSHN